MAPAEPPSSITLKVKVPPGYIEGGGDDFELGTFSSSATIRHVREIIQEKLPSHPTPERQRLLYGGRALVDDEQTLADALNTKRDVTQRDYVIHLLVKGEGGSTAPSAHRRGVSMPSNLPAATPEPQQAATQAQQPPQPQFQLPQGQEQPHSMADLHAQLQQQTEAINQQLHQMHMPPHVRHQMMLQQLAQAQAQRNAGMNVPPQHAGILRAGVPGFNQAVQFGQQQRAGMGMQGVGGQQDGSMNRSQTPQTNGQQAPGQQQNTDQPQTAQPDAAAPEPQTATPNTTNGQPQIPRHPADRGPPQLGRPGVNRFQFHHQVQTFNLPNLLPPPPALPDWAQARVQQLQQQQPPQPNAPSALDRARENMAEMRRLIEEMRADGNTGPSFEEQRVRLGELQQAVNDYIDPMHLGAGAPQRPGQPAATRAASVPPQRLSTTPIPPTRFMPPFPANFRRPPTNFHEFQQRQGAPPPPNPTDTTCYLLSTPTGPQALVFSPQHGNYMGGFGNEAIRALPLTPTPTTHLHAQTASPPPANPQGQPNNAAGRNPLALGANGFFQAPAPANAVEAAAAQHLAQAAAQQAQAGAANPAADPQAAANAGMNALLNHFWLLFRILIFAYFLLGSNMGWRRPVALLVIGLGFWMVRMGLFGEGGVARRWWEDVVRIGPPAAAAGGGEGQAGVGGEVQAGQEPAQGQAQAGNGNGNGNGARQPMPTPEQVAQRLLNERQQAQNARVRQFREYIRPVERAVALFVASLWPGIGEAHVRAREEEARRRAEEEVAARRREEEEREKAEKEESEKRDREGGAEVEKVGEDKAESSQQGAASSSS